MALDTSKKYIAALVLTAISVIITLIAYASPHWVDSFPNSDNPFLNAGLWEICWNDYTFPLDLLGRRFVGCFWVLGRDLYEFRDTILSVWFIFVIIIYTLQLATQLVTAAIVVLSWIRCFPRSLQYGIHYGVAGSYAAMAVLSFIGLVLFGVKKEDREWMFRPDQNILSWCYGLSVCAMLFNLICGYLFYKIGKKEEQERQKNYGY